MKFTIPISFLKALQKGKFLCLECIFIASFISLHAQNFEQDSLLGDFYFQKSEAAWPDVDACLHFSKQAIPLLKKTAQWEKYICTLCGMNSCYNAKSQSDSMEVVTILAYNAAQKYLPKNHTCYYYSVNNLALNYSKIKEDDVTALKIYKKAYQAILQEKIIDPTAKAPLEENIGQVLYRLGDFNTSVLYYNKAIETWQQLSMKKDESTHLRIAILYGKIATLYYNIGKFESSEKYVQKQLNTLKLVQSADQNFSTRAIINLARLNIKLNKNNQALSLLDELLRDANPPLDLKVKILYNQGVALFNLKKYATAIEILNNGLLLSNQINQGQIRVNTSIHQTLSEIYRAQNQFKQALKHQQIAVRLLAPDEILINDLDTPAPSTTVFSKLELFKTLVAKGKITQQLYRETKQLKYLETTFQTYQYLSHLTDDIRSFYQSDDSQLLLLDQAKDFYEAAITTSFLLFEKKKNPKYLNEAFFFSEKSKSELLLEELRKKEFSGQNIIADSLIKKQYHLKTVINFYKKTLKKENAKTGIKDDLKIRKLKDSLFISQRELSSLEDLLQLNHPNYTALTQQSPITLNDLQKELDTTQIILEYFVGEKNIFLFKVTSEEVQLIKIPLDFDLNVSLAQLFNHIKMTGIDGLAQYSTIAYELYSKLLQPNQLVLDKKNIIIIPDGQLENLPFDILVMDSVVANSPKQVNYFIKNFATSYAYSATIFAHQKQQAPSVQSSIKGVFPIFEGTKKKLSFSESVYQSLNRFKGSFLKKDKATISNFLENIEDFQIIHFSTHARRGDTIQNEPSIDLIDGSLLLSDLQTYNLSASLAVLSACETNVGKYRKGEGIMSLSRGFTFAGVPSVITSTSNVYEKSTSKIMQALYKNLEKKQQKHQALRQAKLEYLTSKNISEAGAAPYFWGTFLAIGNMDHLNFEYAEQTNNNFWKYFLVVFIMLNIGYFLQKKFKKITNESKH